MFRIIALAGLMYVTYRLGEQKGRLNDMDFFVTNSIDNYTYYLIIKSSGQIDFIEDMNQATAFNFWDASKLKNIIRKFSPETKLKLETVSNVLTAQQTV